MAKIVFFSIPAYGHTNPTIAVVHALTQRGHAVRYYSFEMFREKIEAAGAEFIPCDAYMPPLPKDHDRLARYDFSSLIGMVTQVTIAMEDTVIAELEALRPDCIVSDSLCIWGKLFARRLGIPMVCSTTSFAFNGETAKMMRPGLREMFYTILGVPKMGRYMKRLRAHGYVVDNVTELIQNDNNTDTIVYTSRAFQPLSETFGERYAFVGPSLPQVPAKPAHRERPLVYVSLGTVIKNKAFFQNCVEALRDCPYDVVMSVGEESIVASLRDVPAQFQVAASVNQLQVLVGADVFITHCGMNSVNESIYLEVPMVLAPQHSEQGAGRSGAARGGGGRGRAAEA